MEWVVLGDPIIYMHQCCSQKFFAGKQRPDALFLFYQQSGLFCNGQAALQLFADVIDESIESALIYFVSWKSFTKNFALYRLSIAWWMEFEPGI